MRYAALALVAGCYFEPEPPVLHNIAFVTSHPMPATSIAGADGADRYCQDAADAAKVKVPGHFIAWVSTDSGAAPTRFGAARGWVRPDGRPFADSIADLLAGRIYYPLRIDENGDDVVIDDPLSDQTPVATGTHFDGTDTFDCANFSQQTGVDALFGYPDATTEMWTDHARLPCETLSRLYCFGTDVDGEVEPPSETGRLAFLTTREFVPGPGESPDDLCNFEASMKGRSGTFAAVIGRSTDTIPEHFGDGPPWVRPDGVLVTTNFRSLQAPINVTLDRDYVGEVHTWGGVENLMFGATPNQNCGDWADPTLDGIVGLAGRSDKHAMFDSTGSSCTDGWPIYCAEL